MSESDFKVIPSEAHHWWLKHEPAGVLLNRMMLLFVVVPIALVFKELYTLSFVVFAFMVPYGLFVRHLAVRAVRQRVAADPEMVEEFERGGVIRIRIAGTEAL